MLALNSLYCAARGGCLLKPVLVAKRALAQEVTIMRLTIKSVQNGKILFDTNGNYSIAVARATASVLVRDFRDRGGFLCQDNQGKEHCRIVFGESVCGMTSIEQSPSSFVIVFTNAGSAGVSRAEEPLLAQESPRKEGRYGHFHRIGMAVVWAMAVRRGLRCRGIGPS
jgi:hypothetical protein